MRQQILIAIGLVGIFIHRRLPQSRSRSRRSTRASSESSRYTSARAQD